MDPKTVPVLGRHLGELRGALAVGRELEGDAEVRVVSASDHLLFNVKHGVLIPGPMPTR